MDSGKLGSSRASGAGAVPATNTPPSPTTPGRADHQDAQKVAPGTPPAGGAASSAAGVSGRMLADRVPQTVDPDTGGIMLRNPLVDLAHAAAHYEGGATETASPARTHAPSVADSKGAGGLASLPTWGAAENAQLISDLGVSSFSAVQVLSGTATLAKIRRDPDQLFSPGKTQAGPFKIGPMHNALRRACQASMSEENFGFLQAVAAYKSNPGPMTAGAIQNKFIRTDSLNIQSRDRQALGVRVDQALQTATFPADLFDGPQPEIYKLIVTQSNVQALFAALEAAVAARGAETKARD